MARRRREKLDSSRSQTLPPSPSHSFSSSSSSDFEFTISISPRKSSTTLCPADELFYKGQLLPLHLSPRLSMVRHLLASSSTTSSSSDTTTTASRDSTGSSSNESTNSFDLLAECDSSRPSSVTEDEEFKRLTTGNSITHVHSNNHQIKKNKYFSLSRFSSVFKKEKNNQHRGGGVRDGGDKLENVKIVQDSSSVKRMSEVIRKYMKKVKPLYEKLSQKQQQQQQKIGGGSERSDESATKNHPVRKATISHSFSGNLRYPRKRSCVSSCPSSMRSSPSHSGALCRNGNVGGGAERGLYSANASSMEELQSAIQGAIAHCKNSLNKTTLVSNDEI